MNRGRGGSRASVLVVAIGDYEDPAYERLELAPQAARALAQALVSGGCYHHDFPELLSGGKKADIIPSVRQWFHEAREKDMLFFFWTGHGKSEAEGHYLITKESPAKDVDAEVAFSAATLGAMVAKSPADKILVVLDTCYSGAGAADVAAALATILATRIPKAGRSRAVAVIASAHPMKKAQEGRLCGALTKVLADAQAIRPWSDNDQYIRTTVLTEALEESLGGALDCKTDGSQQEFVPNPRYRGALPAADMETRRRQLAMPEAQAHFLPASRGIEVGEMTGWYFTGRERLLTALVAWMATAEHGLVIVTGPAGSGKSAVLGRLAILSDPEYRALATTEEALPPSSASIPPVGSIDVAVHAKGKTLLDCGWALADGLDINILVKEGASLDATQLVDALLAAISADNLDRRFTLLVDALDEAPKGHAKAIGSRLLKPLAALPNMRVLVGVRRDPDGGVLAETEDRHARLRAVFGDQAIIHDLDDAPDTGRDIADYVSKRLRSSRHKDKPSGQIDGVAHAIAERADGIFLYARVVSRTLMELDRLDGPLPDSALEAFVSDLTLRFKDDTARVHDLLRALAWSEGKGLTRRVWAPIASALSREGAVYDDHDISWALDYAGAHIVESGEAGQAVYRLAHQAFADHYRTQHAALAAHGLITRAISEGINEASWLDVDGYLIRHLATHAAVAGALPQLIIDPGYLAVADPSGLLFALRTIREDPERKLAEVYRRVESTLQGADPIERMALIHLTACQEEPEIAHDLEPPVPTAWRCRWAWWSRSSPHIVLRDHEERVFAVAMGEIDGEPVVVSGSGDHTVRLWNARTGAARGDPLRGHEDAVSAVAWGEIDGEPVVVSGGYDHTVRLWDARTGAARGDPLRGHDMWVIAVAMGAIDGEPVVVSGSWDNTVRLWDARTGAARGDPLQGHEDRVQAVAMGAIDGEPVVVSGSWDNTVRLWDARTGAARGDPLRGHEDGAFAVAWGEIDGEPVVVSGGDDHTVRLWDARTGAARGDPLQGHEHLVFAVAMCEIDGAPVVVSGSADSTVRLWNARTGAARGDPLRGHEGGVLAVAWGEIDGEPVVVSGGGDHTVRLWNACTEAARGDPLQGRDTRVNAVAMGAIDGEPVVVSGGYDHTVRLWDARTGAARGDPLQGHEDRVQAVAMGEIDGEPVVVSGSGDNTVRLWDARTGAARGDPLRGHEYLVLAVAWGEIDGEPVVVSGSADSTVRLWDARTGAARGDPLRGHEHLVSAVAWGEIDGEPVVVSDGDSTVRLWDARTGAARGDPLRGHEGGVLAVAWGEIDGEPVVVSGSGDNTVRLWDARTGAARGDPLRGHEDLVFAVAMCEIDGAPVVVSGSADSTVRLWNARTGLLTASIRVGSSVSHCSIANGSAIAIATARGLLILDVGETSS